jgi:hypothetical protein
VHILLVNLYEQAYGYVFKESSNFQMVGPTRNTPNGFDASGNGDLPPPPPMTPVETFMAAQTEVLRQNFADAIANRATDAPETTSGS